MKTFLYAALFAALCVTACNLQAQERISSARPSNKPTVRANEKYYAIFLAHQSHDNTIAMSHTFAVFMRTTGDNGNRKILETATINWLPASGHISIIRPAELGVNKPLAETLQWAKDRNLEITMAGPYEIDAVFYKRAVEQVGRLERGEFQYRCNDMRSRATSKNCIHAVSDIFDDVPPVDTGMSRGHEATMKVVEFYKPRLKSKQLMTSDWDPILANLDLSQFRAAQSDMTAAAE